jgi:hypothetical protein
MSVISLRSCTDIHRRYGCGRYDGMQDPREGINRRLGCIPRRKGLYIHVAEQCMYNMYGICMYVFFVITLLLAAGRRPRWATRLGLQGQHGLPARLRRFLERFFFSVLDRKKKGGRRRPQRGAAEDHAFLFGLSFLFLFSPPGRSYPRGGRSCHFP